MIKVAIAGTNGLAQLLAHYISSTTSHQFVFLSRRPVPGLTAKGWQVIVVDYNNTSALKFTLAGVDTVISTVSGTAQLTLIDCAASAKVRRFVPSEFSGPPGLRPQDNNILDNSRNQAIVRLAQHESSSGMKFAVFTCGIFYERFAPGGLAASQLGLSSHIGNEGDYIMDYRRKKAQVPYNTTSGHSPVVSMISVKDLAHCVVAALSISPWRREFRVRGDRMSVNEIVRTAEHVRGRRFDVEQHTRQSVADALKYARAVRDRARETKLHHVVATSEGRLDFADTNLNDLISFRPEKFREWLARVWENA